VHSSCNLQELIQQYKDEAHGVDLTSDERDPTSVDVFDSSHLKKAAKAKPSLSVSTEGDLANNSKPHVSQKRKQELLQPHSYKFPPGDGGAWR
jgi:hypothetical protein